MNAVTSTALSGLSAAQADLRGRAHNLANLGTDGFRRTLTVHGAGADGGVSTTTTRASAAGRAPVDDLVGAWQARHAFAANLALFRSADAMAGALLDLRA